MLVAASLIAAVAVLGTSPADAQSSGRATGTATGSAGARDTGARSAPATRGQATGVMTGTRQRVGSTPSSDARAPIFGVRARPPASQPSTAGVGGRDPHGFGSRVVPAGPGGFVQAHPYRWDPYAGSVYRWDPYAAGYDWRRAGYATGYAADRWRWRPYPQLGVFAGVYFPFVLYYPVVSTHYVHVRTSTIGAQAAHAQAPYAPLEPESVPAPAVAPRPPLEECALVMVLQPGNEGYFKELRLPALGALNTDELQRVIDARVAEGVSFRIRDAAGESFEIPAPANLRRVVVDVCR
jgi:hypothetical protein